MDFSSSYIYYTHTSLEGVVLANKRTERADKDNDGGVDRGASTHTRVKTSLQLCIKNGQLRVILFSIRRDEDYAR